MYYNFLTKYILSRALEAMIRYALQGTSRFFEKKIITYVSQNSHYAITPRLFTETRPFRSCLVCCARCDDGRLRQCRIDIRRPDPPGSYPGSGELWDQGGRRHAGLSEG